MRAALSHPAVVEDDDLVGIDDGRQPVGDDDGGAVAGDAVERLLDLALGMAVEGGGRLVQTRIGGDFSMARAMATRCFSPPESFSPRSPTSVS